MNKQYEAELKAMEDNQLNPMPVLGDPCGAQRESVHSLLIGMAETCESKAKTARFLARCIDVAGADLPPGVDAHLWDLVWMFKSGMR